MLKILPVCSKKRIIPKIYLIGKLRRLEIEEGITVVQIILHYLLSTTNREAVINSGFHDGLFLLQFS